MCGFSAGLFVVLTWGYIGGVIRFSTRLGDAAGRLSDPSIAWPLARSLIVGGTAAVLCVTLGFFIALSLRNVAPVSTRGRLMSLMLLPVLVGDLVAGFGLKAMAAIGTWFGSIYSERSAGLVLGSIVIIQVWQYGLLCAYLCWLRLGELERPTIDFAAISGLSNAEMTRDVFWPKCKALCIVLLLFCFFAGAHETAKSWLIFKVSPGTRTTLIGHALWEQYQQRIPVSPQFAVTVSLQECAVVTVVILAAAVLVSAVTLFLISAILSLVRGGTGRAARAGVAKPYPSSQPSSFMVCAVSAIALLPLLAPLAAFSPSLAIEWSSLVRAVLVTCIGALLAAIISIGFGVLLRVASPAAFARFGRMAVVVLLLIMAIRGIPALALILAGYSWFASAASARCAIWTGWALSHALLALPLLGAFIMWVHTRVSRAELEFQEASQVSLSQLVRHSFIARFRLEYVFTLLFAWSMVWNEGTLNRVVSDHVPTFVDLLSRRLSVRPDFAGATSICMISICAACSALLLWITVQARALHAGAGHE